MMGGLSNQIIRISHWRHERHFTARRVNKEFDCWWHVNRYTSVCWAGKFPSMHTSLRAKWTVAFSYLLGLIISLPLAVLKHITLRTNSTGVTELAESICLYEFGENVSVTEHWTWTTYIYFAESLVRFVPALVLATLNWMIMIKFRGIVKTRLQMHSNNQPSDQVSPSSINESSILLMIQFLALNPASWDESATSPAY